MASLYEVQKRFTQAVRNPDQSPISDAEARRRINIYQTLFFNNINQFLVNGFPVLHRVLRPQQWTTLARGFFISHSAQSPYFAHIPKEFVDYLAQRPDVLDGYPAWVAELAHYEWLELDISIRHGDISEQLWQAAGLPAYFAVSPLAELVSYRYEVHRISPNFIPANETALVYYYVVYRDAMDKVSFLQVNELTAFLIQNVGKRESFKALFQRIQAALPHRGANEIEHSLKQTLSELLQAQIFIQA